MDYLLIDNCNLVIDDDLKAVVFELLFKDGFFIEIITMGLYQKVFTYWHV